MPEVLQERDWVRDLTEGNSEAQVRLREILHRGLLKALRGRGVAPDLVEDFVQEAFLRILDRLPSFRGESRFTTWAMAIAVRVAMTELRRARWRDRSLDEILDGSDSLDVGGLLARWPEAEHQIQRRAILEAMEQVLRTQLTDRQRKVLRAELAGVPKAVLEQELGSRRNALYKLTHDARRRLREGILALGISPEDVRASFEL